jgi:uncharacterized protein
VDDRDYVVRDNPKGRRYELLLDGKHVGEILYSLKPAKIVLLHTEIDPALEGTGLGGHLVADALDDIRARGLNVVPLCPFVAAYIRRHPEYEDLVTRERSIAE